MSMNIDINIDIDVDIDALIGKVLSGSKFNRMFKGIQFVKLTNATEIHNKYLFGDGLNIDFVPFNPTGECEPGGIYFIIASEIKKWIYYNQETMIHIRKVVIPNNAKIYVEDGKFKADKIVLGPKELITTDMYKESFYYNIVYDSSALRHIPVHAIDKDMCLRSIRKSVTSLRFIPAHILDKEICIEAIKRDHRIITYIMNHNIWIEATKKDYNVTSCISHSLMNTELCNEVI